MNFKAFYQKNKALAIGLIVLVGAILITIIISVKRAIAAVPEVKSSSKGGDAHFNTGIAGGGPKWKNDNFPLTLYSSGARVTLLQWLANREHNAGLVEDGKFGPKTAAAFAKYFSAASIDETKYNSLLAKYNTPNNKPDTKTTVNNVSGVVLNPSKLERGEKIFAGKDGVKVYQATKVGTIMDIDYTKEAKLYNLGDLIGKVQYTEGTGDRIYIAERSSDTRYLAVSRLFIYVIRS